MFKGKLTKKGLTANGLLLLVAAFSIAATRQQADVSQRNGSDSTAHQLGFDTILLKLNGASEFDRLHAPVIGLNNQASLYATDYISKNSELLHMIEEKSANYFRIADAVFRKYRLPVELKYLAVIESELNVKALSRVGARGAWQLMPETARSLSLKVTSRYDERTHYYKSTVAAAKYLRDLYAIFGDWTLVIASYNGGPGTVLDAIKKSGSKNFWKLQKYLPAETRGHVKRFISTHYFFEGKGSVVTLTRDEVLSYRKKMEVYVMQQNNLMPEKQTATIALAKADPNEEKQIVKAANIVDPKLSN